MAFPKWLTLPVCVVAGVIAAWVAVAHYGTARYAAGRRSVTQSAISVLPGTTVARAAEAMATAKTDTIVERVVVTRWKVDTLIREVPDTLKSIPQITALIAATRVLTAQVDTLAHTLDVERAVSRLRAMTDSATFVSLSTTMAHKDDEIQTLKKRPTWRTVVTVGALGVVAGLLR
jgi:hypothetical protein